jgi:hypothetical protein
VRLDSQAPKEKALSELSGHSGRRQHHVSLTLIRSRRIYMKREEEFGLIPGSEDMMVAIKDHAFALRSSRLAPCLPLCKPCPNTRRESSRRIHIDIADSSQPFKMHTEPTTFSAESYFAIQPPPPTLKQDVKRVRDFILRQQKEGRNVVLVTVSGARRNISSRSHIHACSEWWYNRTIRAQRVSSCGCKAS